MYPTMARRRARGDPSDTRRRRPRFQRLGEGMTQSIRSDSLKVVEIVDQPADKKALNGGNGKRSARHEPPKAGDHGWDDPDWTLLDDRRGELPDFPINVFAQAWQDLLLRASHGAGVRPEHVAVPLLGIASSLIGTARLEIMVGTNYLVGLCGRRFGRSEDARP